MKTKLLLLAVSVAAFTSCSTIYKTGQTPDDVYYSPARTYDEAQTENKDEVRNDQSSYVYTGEDRMIRMGIADSRWRYLNYDYGYSPYDYSYYNRFNSSHGYYGSNNYYGYGSNFNNIYFNDYYYNPFYSPYPVYIKPATLLKNSTPRVTNLNGYGHNYNNANTPLMSIPAARPVRNYNNNNTRTSGLGNILDKVLSPSSSNSNTNNNYNNTRSSTERTYTPPPASSSNSSSGSSSSGGGSRITRPN